MTIIAVRGREMAADSRSFCGEVSEPLPSGQRKIVRCPDGSLVGIGGSSQDAYTLGQWLLDGSDWAARPKLRYTDMKDDGAIDYLRLKPDGTLWRGGCDLLEYPIATPNVVGVRDACTFCMGAMLTSDAPLSYIMTVTLARCEFVGGTVQIECLDHPQS